jgi:hypothetical protein
MMRACSAQEIARGSPRREAPGAPPVTDAGVGLDAGTDMNPILVGEARSLRRVSRM